MNSTEIRDKIANKEYEPNIVYPKIRKYSENHIFDEEKSVKWNREEVIRKNNEFKEQMDAYKELQSAKYKEFEDDLVTMVIDEYYINDNRAVAEKIVSKAYIEGHDNGKYGVLSTAEELADFVEDIMKLI